MKQNKNDLTIFANDPVSSIRWPCISNLRHKGKDFTNMVHPNIKKHSVNTNREQLYERVSCIVSVHLNQSIISATSAYDQERDEDQPVDEGEQQNFLSSTCLTSSPINQEPALTSSWAYIRRIDLQEEENYG